MATFNLFLKRQVLEIIFISNITILLGHLFAIKGLKVLFFIV